MDDQVEDSPAFADLILGSTQSQPSALTKRQPPRPYTTQLQNDAAAVKGFVKRRIMVLKANGKWGNWTTDAQRSFIEKDLETALNQREASLTTTSVRIEYPEIWQREREAVTYRWIGSVMRAVNASGTSCSQVYSQAIYEDRDDEERSLPVKGMKGEQGSEMTQAFTDRYGTMIKAKERHDFVKDSDDESASSELESKGEEESDTSKYGGYSTSIACSRSLAIGLSFEGGQGKELVEGVTRRYWKWDDTAGEFVEWPPL